MTTSAKTTLRTTLAQTEQIDPNGLSPFVALHLGEPDRLHVRRTGAVGLVETVDAPPPDADGWVYVAYNHLQDCLRFIESDEVAISVLGHGGVQLRTVNSPFETELRVHTVPAARSGFKRHTPGDPFTPLDPTWLNGLNVKSLTLVTPPLLEGQKLLLLTSSGMVTWATAFDAQLPTHPRESFLKAIAGMTEGTLELTERGFFHAILGGVHIYTAGHQSKLMQAGALGHPDGELVVSLPAGRLVQALKSAVALAGQGAGVQISPKAGVTTRDSYANPARFSLGDVPPFPTLSVTAKTAALLADSLCQTLDPEVLVRHVAQHPDVYRMTRGGCEVSFRTIPLA